jgi:hypothetical protein
LQVWGTLPVKLPPRHDNPEVAVGSLDALHSPDTDITIDPLPSYRSLDASCTAYLASRRAIRRLQPSLSRCSSRSAKAWTSPGPARRVLADHHGPTIGDP